MSFAKKDNKTLWINNVCLHNLENIIETGHGKKVLINSPLANSMRVDNHVLVATEYKCT